MSPWRKLITLAPALAAKVRAMRPPKLRGVADAMLSGDPASSNLMKNPMMTLRSKNNPMKSFFLYFGKIFGNSK